MSFMWFWLFWLAISDQSVFTSVVLSTYNINKLCLWFLKGQSNCKTLKIVVTFILNWVIYYIPKTIHFKFTVQRKSSVTQFIIINKWVSKQFERSLWTLKLCVFDSFWSTLTFVMHILSLSRSTLGLRYHSSQLWFLHLKALEHF